MHQTTITFPPAPQVAAIVLNGARSRLNINDNDERQWQTYRQVIVTDGAWNDFSKTAIGRRIEALSSLPQTDIRLTVLGDGDSIQCRPAQFIHTPHQDFTDFEKALQYAIENGLTAVDVFWASGGEMDHFLGNLSVAAKYAPAITTRFYDDRQCYFYLSGSNGSNSLTEISQTAQIVQTIILTGINDRTVSLYPFPTAVVSSQGLCYELDELALNQHRQQSLRNQAVSDRVILHLRGGIWVFVS